MPVQNYLRGAPMPGQDLPEIGNMLQRKYAVDAEQQRRNALLALDQQEFQAGQQERADLEGARRAYADWQAFQNNPQWRAAVAQGARQKHPEWANATDDELVARMGVELQATLGITPEAAPKRDVRQVGSALVEVPAKGDPRELYRAPPQPQQYGPESFSTELDDQGNILLIGNRGTIRETGRKGPVKGGGSGVSVGPDGALVVDPASIKASEGERKVAALGVRLEAALRNLQIIRERNPGSDRPTYGEAIKAGTPIVGEVWANRSRSSDRQQADAAQTDALDAALTLATGAAYTKEQLEGLRKAYFPQVGDTEETIAFKEQQFNNIVQAARVNAGRAEPTIDAALTKSNQPRPNTKPVPPNMVTPFASEAEAEKAAKAGIIKRGDRISINGVTGTWQ